MYLQLLDMKMKNPVLIMKRLMQESSLFIPPENVGSLIRVEVISGDIPCRHIVTPLSVEIYIQKVKCVSRSTFFVGFWVFFKYFFWRDILLGIKECVLI